MALVRIDHRIGFRRLSICEAPRVTILHRTPPRKPNRTVRPVYPVVVRGVGVIPCPRWLSSTSVRMYGSRLGARRISPTGVVERASASVQQELIDRIGDEVSGAQGPRRWAFSFARDNK